jgi:hypothetical protein
MQRPMARVLWYSSTPIASSWKRPAKPEAGVSGVVCLFVALNVAGTGCEYDSHTVPNAADSASAERDDGDAGAPVEDASADPDASTSDGCCDSDAGRDPNPSAPKVVSTSPAANAVETPPSASISVVFDEAIDPSTLNTDNFTLEVLGGPRVSGTVTVESSGGRFIPDAALCFFTTYVASITTAVTDMEGNPLAADISWSFKTVRGSWGVAEVINLDNGSLAGSPQVVSDPVGNAIALWWQEDGDIAPYRANRFAVGSGWEGAVLIDSDVFDDASPLNVAVDPAGNAYLVGVQWNGVRHDIYFNRYLVGSG